MQKKARPTRSPLPPLIPYRWIGMALFTTLIAAIAWIATLLILRDPPALHTLKIRLTEIGTLERQSKVQDRGVEIGEVDSIFLENNEPHAIIQFYEAESFRQGTRFVNMSNGAVLGTNLIKLFPSDTGAFLDSTSVPLAEFEPGLTESMHKLEEILNMVQEIAQLIYRMEKGDANQSPFAPSFNSVIAKIGALTQQTHNVLEQIEKPALAATLQAQGQIRATQKILDQTNQHAQEVWRLERTITPQVDSAFRQLLQITQTLESTLDTLEQNKAYLQLTRDRKTLDAFHELTLSVDRAVLALRSGEVIPGMGKDPLVRARNVHLFRATAHKKLQDSAKKVQQKNQTTLPKPN